MTRWSGVACALLLSGCAHGVVTALPTVDPSQAAEIAVVRPNGFKGCAITFPVMVDGREVFRLACGEHIVYPVTAGEHRFGINAPNVVGMPDTNVTPLTVIARTRYYLRLDSLLWHGPVLTPITTGEGERLFTETTPLGKP
jgi:hypothetical protein